VDRFLIALVVVAAVAAVAVVMQRRRPDAPTQRVYNVPVQLDREDFPRSATPWLVVVFTSATCGTCAQVVAEVEVTAEADLHQRYGIDAVPTLVVADADGVVRRSFLGPVTATDLWAAVAEVREPGTLPPGGCQSGHDEH
jgi:thioredoxin-related protein